MSDDPAESWEGRDGQGCPPPITLVWLLPEVGCSPTVQTMATLFRRSEKKTNPAKQRLKTVQQESTIQGLTRNKNGHFQNKSSLLLLQNVTVDVQILQKKYNKVYRKAWWGCPPPSTHHANTPKVIRPPGVLTDCLMSGPQGHYYPRRLEEIFGTILQSNEGAFQTAQVVEPDPNQARQNARARP